MIFYKTIKQILLFFFFFLIFSCDNDNNIPKEEPKIINNIEKQIINIDLDDIIKRDTLKAITVYSPTSYFLYKGEPMGFEYDLLNIFAKKIGVELEIVVAHNINEMFNLLNLGKGDLIAYGITITEKRKQQVSFTKAYMNIYQVLIQKKPDNWIKLTQDQIKKHLITDVTKLANKTISVRKNSSYYERLLNLSNEIGSDIIIDTVAGDLTTDDLINLVSKGKIQYTISDDNIAKISSLYYPNIDINTDISLSQNLAWVVRKSSTNLLNKLNAEIDKAIGSKNYNITYNKYFKNKRLYIKRLENEYFTKETGKLSKYDILIKKYAANINWDWLLLSSQIYQESRFNNNRKSWAGASGLMQIMPRTARELGVKNVYNPENNIQAGTKYLKKIWSMWENIPDSIQRIKLTLASYNCGYYHVKDAQFLAKKYNKNYLKWDNGIDEFILKLSKPNYYNQKGVKYGYVRGREPYNYIKNIFVRYEIYKDLIGHL